MTISIGFNDERDIRSSFRCTVTSGEVMYWKVLHEGVDEDSEVLELTKVAVIIGAHIIV